MDNFYLKILSIILRILNFIGVKIKNKKDSAHTAFCFLPCDAKHIINFSLPNYTYF